MSVRHVILLTCVSSLLAGCGGSQLDASPPNDALPAAAAASVPIRASVPTRSAVSRHRGKAKVTLHIRIPRRKKRAHFISPATQGIGFVISGSSSLNVVAGLTPSSNPNCQTVSGVTNCTVALSIEAGTYTMNVTTYDQPPAGAAFPLNANALDTASNVPFMVQMAQTNSVSLTLSGVPALFAVTAPSATAGTPFSTPKALPVTVKDADGTVIVGPYANPVTLSSGDSTGATTIATTGADHPPAGELLSSNDSATLNYSGLAIAPATIAANSGSAPTGSAKFSPALAPIVVTTSDSLNPSFAGVDLYATSGTGSTAGFTVSEVGWTNAPYNKTISTTPSGCSQIATVAPASGTSFTATVAGSPFAGTCSLALGGGPQSLNMTLAYSDFEYADREQDFVVPAGVTGMMVTAAGAQGGDGQAHLSYGGLGGSITATLPVTPLETLAVFVGGYGTEGVANCVGISITAGFNGGGNGMCATSGGGGGGGGGSDIREDGNAFTNRIIAAGGGGGGGGYWNGATYTAGTGGQDGTAGYNGSTGVLAGHGATQSTFGTGGTSSGCGTNSDGALGQGGSTTLCTYTGGGGGGGYYGGGGGGGWTSGGTAPNFAAGGGGGSSWAEATATSVTYTSGTQSGNGKVVVIF